MPIRLRPAENLWNVEVTPPHGNWQSSTPMTIGGLIEALRSIGCAQEEIDSALREAGTAKAMKYWESRIGPTVHAALAGEYEVPPQEPFVEAWLAYVLFSQSTPIPMKNVVGIADAVNKTVPTPDEIAWAFLQLKERGWFVDRDGLYGLTSEGRATIESILGDACGFGAAELLEVWLSKHPPSPQGK